MQTSLNDPVPLGHMGSNRPTMGRAKEGQTFVLQSCKEMPEVAAFAAFPKPE